MRRYLTSGVGFNRLPFLSWTSMQCSPFTGTSPFSRHPQGDPRRFVPGTTMRRLCICPILANQRNALAGATGELLEKFYKSLSGAGRL